MKYAKGTFTVVPNRELLRGLPPTTQALYVWLCSYADENGECYPSRSKLATDIGGSVRTVDTHLKKLENLGLIEKENRVKNNEKQSNLYQLLIVESSAKIAPPSADIALPRANTAPPSADIAHRTKTTQLLPVELKNIYGELKNVELTEGQHATLYEKWGATLVDELIDDLSLYIPNKPGKKYSDHYAVINSWARKRSKEVRGNHKTFSVIG